MPCGANFRRERRPVGGLANKALRQTYRGSGTDSRDSWLQYRPTIAGKFDGGKLLSHLLPSVSCWTGRKPSLEDVENIIWSKGNSASTANTPGHVKWACPCDTISRTQMQTLIAQEGQLVYLNISVIIQSQRTLYHYHYCDWLYKYKNTQPSFR
jgi:hypothetical protein